MLVDRPISMRQPQAGFTLVELLVVLAILGLLVALATPQVLKYLDTSKVSTAKIEVENLLAALDLFKIDMDRYPTTEEGLAALVEAPPGAADWKGPYVKKNTSFTDPWGHPWNYRSPGEHGTFDLYSAGPNQGGAGGAGQIIANW
jgi:general secretion pathway protein G